ncbi:hypothetical protein GCM10010357_23230 [Streptomyces luteireticuli]|uniref:Uncharacterized protein n=1 Tax=Streptomyces luteireticuli TaxID=173858 RepID=A0ABN0YMT7_9ACTN
MLGPDSVFEDGRVFENGRFHRDIATERVRFAGVGRGEPLRSVTAADDVVAAPLAVGPPVGSRTPYLATHQVSQQ